MFELNKRDIITNVQKKSKETMLGKKCSSKNYSGEIVKKELEN